MYSQFTMPPKKQAKGLSNKQGKRPVKGVALSRAGNKAVNKIILKPSRELMRSRITQPVNPVFDSSDEDEEMEDDKGSDSIVSDGEEDIFHHSTSNRLKEMGSFEDEMNETLLKEKGN